MNAALLGRAAENYVLFQLSARGCLVSPAPAGYREVDLFAANPLTGRSVLVQVKGTQTGVRGSQAGKRALAWRLQPDLARRLLAGSLPSNYFLTFVHLPEPLPNAPAQAQAFIIRPARFAAAYHREPGTPSVIPDHGLVIEEYKCNDCWFYRI